MAYNTLLTALLLSSLQAILARRAHAYPNIFINPRPQGAKFVYDHDASYTVGYTLPMQWNTTYDTLTLMLWQNGNSTPQTILDSVDKRTSYSWLIDLKGLFSVEQGEVFQFTIYNGGPLSNNGQFSSHYINITDPSAPASSSSSSAPATSATSPPTSSTSVTQSSGLSSSAKIGIGVGVGVGGLLLLIGAGFLFFFCRRRGRKDRQEGGNGSLLDSGWASPRPEQYGLSQHGSMVKKEMQSPQELPPGNGRSEMMGDTGPRGELPSSPKVTQERQELPG